MSTELFVRTVALGGAGLLLAAGAWAFADPSSFYAQVATFEPYNRHFLHDAGAFQLGLGAGLLVGVLGLSGRSVALWGAAVAGALHALSHFLDWNLGGRAADPVGLSIIAAVLLAGAALSTRTDLKNMEVGNRATSPPPAGVREHRPPRAPQHD
jgi:hypothetical protein